MYHHTQQQQHPAAAPPYGQHRTTNGTNAPPPPQLASAGMAMGGAYNHHNPQHLHQQQQPPPMHFQQQHTPSPYPQQPQQQQHYYGGGSGSVAAHGGMLRGAQHHHQQLPASHQQPPQQQQQGYRNLYVSGLPATVNDDDLKTVFDKFGKIESAKVMIDVSTGLSRGFAFVLFSKVEEGCAAFGALNGKDVTVKGETFKMKLMPSEHDGRQAATATNIIYVRNLPSSAPEPTVREHFAKFGDITAFSMRPIAPPANQQHPSAADSAAAADASSVASPTLFLATVEYQTVEAATKAIEGTHGRKIFDGCTNPVLAKFADTLEMKEAKKVKRGAAAANAAAATIAANAAAAAAAAQLGFGPNGALPPMTVGLAGGQTALTPLPMLGNNVMVIGPNGMPIQLGVMPPTGANTTAAAAAGAASAAHHHQQQQQPVYLQQQHQPQGGGSAVPPPPQLLSMGMGMQQQQQQQQQQPQLSGGGSLSVVSGLASANTYFGPGTAHPHLTLISSAGGGGSAGSAAGHQQGSPGSPHGMASLSMFNNATNAGSTHSSTAGQYNPSLGGTPPTTSVGAPPHMHQAPNPTHAYGTTSGVGGGQSNGSATLAALAMAAPASHLPLPLRSGEQLVYFQGLLIKTPEGLLVPARVEQCQYVDVQPASNNGGYPAATTNPAMSLVQQQQQQQQLYGATTAAGAPSGNANAGGLGLGLGLGIGASAGLAHQQQQQQQQQTVAHAAQIGHNPSAANGVIGTPRTHSSSSSSCVGGGSNSGIGQVSGGCGTAVSELSGNGGLVGINNGLGLVAHPSLVTPFSY